MNHDHSKGDPVLTIYTTSPQAGGSSAPEFCRPVVDVARWTEAAGMRGLLVFTDNDSIDPWATAQLIIERTNSVVPLVAVQPTYMHPYTAARMVSTIASLYGREVDVNLVTGGYKPDLLALGSLIDHDRRYDRLIEYGEVVTGLLAADPCTYRGEYYQLTDAKIYPPLPQGLRPEVFVSGSSPAAVSTAKALGVVRLTYSRELGDVDDAAYFAGAGVRFGVIARETSAEAWREALRRYPVDPWRERMHGAQLPKIESQWHRDLWRDSGSAPEDPGDRGVYWLHPFRVAAQFCPFLVGSYDEVGELLSRYLGMGVKTLILNTPQDEADLFHAATAVQHAKRLVTLEPKAGG